MKKWSLLGIILLSAFFALSCRSEDATPEADIQGIIRYQNIIFFDLVVNDPEERIEALSVKLREDETEVVTIEEALHLHETTEGLYFQNLSVEKDYRIEVVMTYIRDDETVTKTADSHAFTLERTKAMPESAIDNVRPDTDSVVFDFTLSDPDGAVSGLSVVLYDENEEKREELYPPEPDIGLGTNEDVTFTDLTEDTTYTIRVIVRYTDGYHTYPWHTLAEHTFVTAAE